MRFGLGLSLQQRKSGGGGGGATPGVNLLQKSNIFTDPAWTQTAGVALTAAYGTASNGFPSTRLLVDQNRGLRQYPTITGPNYTVSFFARTITAGGKPATQGWGFWNNTVSATTPVSITSSWQRLSLTLPADGASGIDFYCPDVGGGDIELSSFQLEAGAVMNGYTDVP